MQHVDELFRHPLLDTPKKLLTVELKMDFLKISFLLIASIFLNYCNAQRTPSISYISQEQIKDIGGTVELDW